VANGGSRALAMRRMVRPLLCGDRDPETGIVESLWDGPDLGSRPRRARAVPRARNRQLVAWIITVQQPGSGKRRAHPSVHEPQVVQANGDARLRGQEAAGLESYATNQ
jgi:hypothetical protein